MPGSRGSSRGFPGTRNPKLQPRLGGFVKRVLLPLILLAAAACTTQKKPTAPPPAPPVSPTPGVLKRSDPTVVEETDTYVIRRYPKSQYKKIDDRHFKIPV